MCEDQPMPMTLTIAGYSVNLHVVSFTGLEALNEAYRFDIDLISPDKHLDLNNLLDRTAYLSVHPDHDGVHGRVQNAVQIYSGNGLSHYRVALVPDLQRLALQPRRRRVHHPLSAPQLIVLLLEQQGIDEIAYRFDRMTGLYPCRALCVQFDESDLHLLQRICEEEGIHFHFEHTPTRHTLVFSDDPASFPERKEPLRLRHPDATHPSAPSLVYLDVQLSIDRSYLSAVKPLHGPAVLSEPANCEGQASANNQPFAQPSAAGPMDQGERLSRQRSVRQLERLRCERRNIRGASHQPMLSSGQVMQVLDHPEPFFNDQWLLTDVCHAGRQLQVLEGCDPHDIAAVLGRLPEARVFQGEVVDEAGGGYMNDFTVIPWSMPFRPALKHPKPLVTSPQAATLMRGSRETAKGSDSGRVAIRFDWQTPVNAGSGQCDAQPWPLAHVALSVSSLAEFREAGTRVMVRHFDNDPDRPVIHELLLPLAKSSGPRFQFDSGVVDALQSLHLLQNQRLCIDSDQRMTVRTRQKTLRILPDMISLTDAGAPLTLPGRLSTLRSRPINDLRLTEKPGLQGAPLARRVWHIVRMREPGLQHLARLAPEHLLFEGKTDDHGYLGLTEAQRHQLAVEHEHTPLELCLVHPGHCIALHLYFQQNWTQEQRNALAISNP